MLKFNGTETLHDPQGEALFWSKENPKPIGIAVWLERQLVNVPAGNHNGALGSVLTLHEKLSHAGAEVELNDGEEQVMRNLVNGFTAAPWWLVFNLKYLLWPDELTEEERGAVQSWRGGDNNGK